MGRPVSCEENLSNSSTRLKSCFASSGVMIFSGLEAALDCGLTGGGGAVCEGAEGDGGVGVEVCCAGANTAANQRQKPAATVNMRRVKYRNPWCSIISAPSERRLRGAGRPHLIPRL